MQEREKSLELTLKYPVLHCVAIHGDDKKETDGEEKKNRKRLAKYLRPKQNGNEGDET